VIDARKRTFVVIAVILLAACAGPSNAVAAPPPNDNFASAQNLGSGFPASANGTTVEATREPGEPFEHGSSGSVWYTWTSPLTGRVLMDVCDSAEPQNIAVYLGDQVNALTPWLNYSAENCPNMDWSDRLWVEVEAGTTYRIAVGSQPDGPFGGGPAPFRVRIHDPRPPNDAFARAKRLTGIPVSTTGTTSEATTEDGEDYYAVGGGGREGSVWYSWRAPKRMRVELDICRAPDLSEVHVFTGSSLQRLGSPLTFDGASCANDSLQFRAAKGVEYMIVVVSGDDGGSFRLRLREYLYDASMFQTASRKRVRRGGVVTYKAKIKNVGTWPIRAGEVGEEAGHEFFMWAAKPGRNLPQKRVRYLSVKTTNGSCKKETFGYGFKGVFCAIRRLDPGERMTITARVRLRGSIDHWAGLWWEDMNPRNDGGNLPAGVRKARTIVR
jgi:hypothetical protein